MKPKGSGTQGALLLIGTDWRRNFLISGALRAAEDAGLDVALLDSRDRRGNSVGQIADDRFIPIESDGGLNLATIAERVSAFAERSGIRFEAVFTGLDTHIELAAVLADRLAARGNSAVAARNAQTKSRMRSLLAADDQLSTTFELVESAAAARSMFDRMGAPVVLKPVRGAGSRGVRTGIQSSEQAAVAWQSVSQELQRLSVNGRLDTEIQSCDSIMMERQLSGIEVDVELVLQNGDCRFAAVADNPTVSLPFGIETGTSYPSQLPRSDQQALISGALLALARLGLGDGNFHIEMVLTREGPKVIEVNARMGGAFVWEAMQAVYGIDLVRLGVDAVLNRPLPEEQPSPRGALEAWFFITRVSGEFVRAEGLERLAQCSGYAAMGLWKAEGDAVLAPGQAASDYLGFAAFSGETTEQARGRAADAFKHVAFWIRSANGEVVRSEAIFMHDNG